MKTLKGMVVVLGAAVLAACGTGAPAGAPERDPGLQPDGSVYAALYVSGENRGGYTSVLLDMSEVRVSADGRALDVAFDRGVPDLATGGVRIGTFDVPAGAREVEFVVRFDDYGGYEFGNTGAGELVARRPAIRFKAPVEWLHDRGHAVIHVDLARSLHARGGRVAFVPQGEIRY